MKKVLFVSRDYTAQNDGGSAVAKRNLSFLKASAVEVSELTIGVPSLPIRLKNVLLRESYGDHRALRKLLKHHLAQKYDFVFFDGSHYGGYLREFFRHGFKTVCFFHNVEVQYYKQKYETTHKLQDKLMVGFIRHNEVFCTQYSTYMIALNERDSNQLQDIYHRPADLILPTSFDNINRDEKNEPLDLPEKYLLFVGTNFFANREAIAFYAKEIAPFVHIPLVVVGNISEAFPHTEDFANIRFVGRVKDLAPYYLQSAAVVAPILSGSGLKTKTVEALRYSKFIIGSPESFEGIPINKYPKAGKVCHSSSEYINLINSFDGTKENRESFKLFEENFSTATQLQRFRDFIQEIITNRKDSKV